MISEHESDLWSLQHRNDERLTFGIDIGSGINKLLPVGLDIRPCTDYQGSAENIPFTDKYFVIAVLRHTLEHIQDWKKALSEAERVATIVFVFHPKQEIWHDDYGRVYFDLPEGYIKIREYTYCNLYRKVLQ